MPLITSDIVIVKRHESNSLTLRYTPTPSVISRFASYRFSLTDSTKKTIVKEKAIDDPDRKVEFDDLVPGRLYEISGMFALLQFRKTVKILFGNSQLGLYRAESRLTQCFDRIDSTLIRHPQ